MIYQAIRIPPDSRVFRDAAAKYGLELALLLGLVEKESSFQQGAWNPEPPWKYFWDIDRNRPFRPVTDAEIASEKPPVDFPAPRGVPADAEWWAQQASWGLTQVMGGVARELGYDGPWLTDLLLDPVLVVDLGCRHLLKKLRRYGDNLPPAISAYNLGTAMKHETGPKAGEFWNQDYVDDVLANRDRWRAQLGG